MFDICVDHLKIADRSNDIKDKPGIYVWFYNFKNLQEIFKKGNEKNFYSKLENLINILPELTGTVYSTFDIEYNLDFQPSISFKNLNQIKKEVLNEFLSFLEILELPLYVGRSQNLKERYIQHLGDYKRDSFERDIFASRMVKYKIEIEDLKFCGKYIDNKELINDLEYLLNRVIKPIGGKR